MSLNRKPGQSTPSVQTAARHSLEEMEVDPFPQRCWLFHIRIDAVVDTQRGRERERERERESEYVCMHVLKRKYKKGFFACLLVHPNTHTHRQTDRHTHTHTDTHTLQMTRVSGMCRAL